jgi:hypothetical protein
VPERHHRRLATLGSLLLVGLQDFHALAEDHERLVDRTSLLETVAWIDRRWVNSRADPGGVQLTWDGPVLPVFLVRSEPARSTIESRETCVLDGSYQERRGRRSVPIRRRRRLRATTRLTSGAPPWIRTTFTVKTAWLRELFSFMRVPHTWRISMPFSTTRSASATDRTRTSRRPETYLIDMSESFLSARGLRLDGCSRSCSDEDGCDGRAEAEAVEGSVSSRSKIWMQGRGRHRALAAELRMGSGSAYAPSRCTAQHS